MIYFKSKYLAERLGINLAKWKRWAREFLDPDPLGGYQSGFARQFSFRDAFRVFLGGHLVGALNFTIPQTRQILSDLHPWLKKNQVYAWPVSDAAPARNHRCHVYIYETDAGNGYGYAVRKVSPQTTRRENGRHQEVFTLVLINLSMAQYATARFTHARVIDVDALHLHFRNRIDGD